MLAVRPATAQPEPETQGFWDVYGAGQMAERLGRGEGLVLDWAEEAMRWAPGDTSPAEPSARPVSLRVQAIRDLVGAPWLAGAVPPEPLVVMGEIGALEGEPVLVGTDETGRRVTLAAQCDGGRRVGFAWPLFAQVGLMLSRFSWAGTPGFSGFVRRVDDLWDDCLAALCGGRPLVDELADLLGALAGAVAEAGGARLARVWPCPLDGDGQPYAGVLVGSHDVDAVYADARWRERSYDEQAGNEWFNFPRWMELERELGLRSAFYLQTPTGREYEHGPGYDLRDPAVLEAARRLHEGGWEIGPHLMDADPADLVEQVRLFAALTGVRPPGTRSHYLAHRWDSLDAKAAAGLIYDSTWYPEQTRVGFLCGTVLPFRPVSTKSGEALPLVELSSVVEDGVVTGVYGEGTARDIAGAVEEGAAAVRAAAARGGCIVLNWHQRTFALMDRYSGAPADWTPAYRGVAEVAEAAVPRLWKATPGEVARWWLARAGARVRWREGELELTNEGPAGWRGALLVGAGALAPGEAEGAGAVRHGTGWLVPVQVEAGERTMALRGGGCQEPGRLGRRYTTQ